MPKRYVITLTSDEREWMEQLVSKGKAAARKIKRAQVLLKADAGPHGPGWTDERIREAFGMSVRAIEMLRKRAVERGPEAAVERKRQVGSRATKLDGEAEARLFTLACSTPPAGRGRWSLRLLADRLVTLEIVESVSHETVRRHLKKTF